MKQIVLVLWVFLYVDATIEDLFYCAPAWSKTYLFFCQQFLSLGLESVEITRSMILLGWLIKLMVR